MSTGFTLKFWGVRGSTPTPGGATVRYGGNTSCVELRAGGHLVVLDAGTGIRLLGKSLSDAGQCPSHEVNLLLTHTHWDHIQGLPFFIPQLRSGCRLRILGSEGAREGLATLLARQMESPFFPIPLLGSPANIDIEELKQPEFKIGQLVGRSMPANHPGSCFGYKLSGKSFSVAYFPDHEPYLGKLRMLGAKAKGEEKKRLQQGHAAMVEFIRGIDVLVMDAQYDRDEYAQHVGWGHGCLDDVVALASEAGVKKLILFHHDPDHADSKIDAMAAEARRLAKAAHSGTLIEAAREGAVVGAESGDV